MKRIEKPIYLIQYKDKYTNPGWHGLMFFQDQDSVEAKLRELKDAGTDHILTTYISYYEQEDTLEEKIEKYIARLEAVAKVIGK